MKEKFTVFAAALFMLAACQAEPQITQEIAPAQASEQPQAIEEGVVPPEVTASQENGAPTKSLIEVDGEGVGTIYWTPSDEINVFYGSTSTRYISKNTENATTAVFRTLDVIGTTESATENIWGLYPYNENASCTGSAVTTTLPANQKGVPGTFDDDLYITLAHNTSTALVFWNVCGGIKFSLSRNDITSITFRGNNNEDIAGDISLTFDGETNLPVATVLNGAKEVTLTPKTGTTFASGENYYLILLPGTLSGGFTMTFSASDGTTGTFNYIDKAVTIKRSVFSKKNEIDIYAVFSIPNNQIWYTTSDNDICSFPANMCDGGNVSSNTYDNGLGVVVFDGTVSRIKHGGETVTSMTIPSSITSILGSFRTECPNIEAIYGPNCSEDNCCLVIGGELIAFIPQVLTSYITPNGVTTIGTDAFTACSNLSVLSVNEGVECLSDYSFRNTYLTKIHLPISLTYIGEQVFDGVNVNIPSLSISQNVSFIGELRGAFKVVEIHNVNPATINEKAFGTSATYPILVPNGTLSDYLDAWPGYSSRIVEKSEYPSNEILYTTADGQKVTIHYKSYWADGWKWNSEDIESHSYGRLVFDSIIHCVPPDVFYNEKLSSIIIPDGVLHLGDNCFDGCSSLTSVYLGRSLEIIGDRSFAECTSLGGLQLPNRLKTVGWEAFYGCSALSEITIPKSVTAIRAEAFDDCRSLTAITLFSEVPPIGGNNMFRNTNNCPIYVPAESVEAYKTATYWSDYADRIQSIP